MQVLKGQWNKNCGTKIGGDSWPLGDGDPKCKCKKVSGTKTAEQKLFIILSHPNKKWWGQCKCKKVSGTKIGGRNKKKVSGTKIGEQNKNSGTKIGGQNKKKFSGTKIGEHCQWNKNYLSGNVVNGV